MRFWWTKRTAPSLDERVAEHMRRQKIQDFEWQERILLDGGATLHPANNVAPGTFGYQVLRLEFDGLLAKETVKTGPLPDEQFTRYVLTEKGRTSALMMAD